MQSNLFLAIQITLLGMGLVFGAIVTLWGLMVTLAKYTAAKEPALTPTSFAKHPGGAPDGIGGPDQDLKRRAAAAAVALALADQGSSTAHPLTTPPTALVSAWQLGMRTRQMYEKGSHR